MYMKVQSISVYLFYLESLRIHVSINISLYKYITLSFSFPLYFFSFLRHGDGYCPANPARETKSHVFAYSRFHKDVCLIFPSTLLTQVYGINDDQPQGSLNRHEQGRGMRLTGCGFEWDKQGVG